MNPEQPIDKRIEAALRRRPSDERTYDEPLSPLAASAGTSRAQPRVRLGAPRVRSNLPALAAVCLALIVGASVLAVAVIRNGTAVGPGPTATPSPSPSDLVGCWGAAPAFSPDRLTGTADAESGSSAAAAVLRDLLASGQNPGYPSQGWYLAFESSDQVMFLAGASSPSGYEQVTVERGSGGQFATDGWSLSTYGSCVLYAMPPEGYGTASWRLDPAYPVTPASTELHLLVTENACHGTVAASQDRIRADVVYGDESVTVLISVRRDQGVWTCPTPPSASYVLQLAEPLGDRDLEDGGSWPPVTVLAQSPSPSPSSSPTALPGTPTLTTTAVSESGTTSGCAWTVSFDQPVVSGLPAAVAGKINAAIGARVSGYVSDFKSSMAGMSGESDCSLDGSYKVAYASPSLLSLTFNVDEAMGNGFSVAGSLNFEVSDGTAIELPDLFTDTETALGVLSTESRRQLPGILVAASGVPNSSPDIALIEDGTKPLIGNFEAWALTPAGLQITFQTAQVAGRWAGTPTVTIPWADLASVIDPNGPADEFLKNASASP
jgi:hypothetical protein